MAVAAIKKNKKKLQAHQLTDQYVHAHAHVAPLRHALAHAPLRHAHAHPLLDILDT